MKIAKAILGAVLALSASALCAAEFKLCNENTEVYPWTVKDGMGLNTILLKMASERTGITLTTVRATWEQCLKDVESGKVDGAYAGSHNEKRAGFAMYPMRDGKLDESRRLMTEEYVLYRRKGSKVDWDGSTIQASDRPIGVQREYSIGGDLTKWGVKFDNSSNSPDELLQKVARGDFDAAALLSYVGYDLAKRPEFAGKLEKLAQPLIQKPYFLFFNKQFYLAHTKEIDAVWAAIAEARESPRYKAVESAVLEK